VRAFFFSGSNALYDDVDDRIREALERPLDIREKLQLPPRTPVEQLERTRLKPVPARGKKGIVPK
jgi:hypothetical protein